MPIRIYALAKELDIDSKELVNVCTKAGVTGKGSALASLTDDEVTKIKAHLTKQVAEPSMPVPEAPVRPPAHRKPPTIRTITTKKPVTPTQSEEAAPASESPAETTPPLAPSVTPSAPEPPAPAAPEPPVISSSGDTKKSGFTRDDYIAPGGSGRKPSDIKPLGVKMAGKKKDGGDAGSKQPARKGPVIKLANIPQPTSPPPKPTKSTDKTQKPIMTLPPDAISRAKAGGRAPLEQFTKQQDKKRSVDSDKRGGGKPTGRLKPGERPLSPAEMIPAGEGKSTRRRVPGKSGQPADEEGGEGKKKLAGMASARASRNSNRRRGRLNQDDDDDGRRRSSTRRLQRRGGTNTAAPRKGKVTVELPCTVRSLSESTGIPTAQIQRTLMGLGTMLTINAEIDTELAELVASELDMDVEFKQPESLEDALVTSFELVEDDPDSLETRPPIITFLGHVDHGKTSLLDRIIGINVVDREAGGITQHIRAYKIGEKDREIAFVDTPGHEAFTEMRARGANVTDIAVLVVAADDGVMPQTEEAISHARAAEVPIVVALNKIDLPSADENKVYQDLSTHGLLPTEWGGDVEVVKTSATTGEGIEALLETLLLTAELYEYKANPSRDANGICLEAQQDGDKGVVAKMIVTNGTLNIGDVVVCGGGYGKVKAMYHTLNVKQKLQHAGPSTPVSLMGLDVAPEAGEPFYVMRDVAKAREIAEARKDRSRSQSLASTTVRVSFEEFQKRLEEGRLANPDEITTLNMILRADVRGSIEAIQKELEKLDHPEVKINVLQASVGGITSADVTLADASEAVIVGFNVIPDENARLLADQRGVQIRRYDIIYKVTEDLKLMLEGKLRPEERVTDLGRALVQRLFVISRIGTIAGCRVLAGRIERGCRIRVNRDGRGIGDYPLDSLRREKDDAKEVREGFECGIKLSGFNDLKEGDILEAYKIEEVARTL